MLADAEASLPTSDESYTLRVTYKIDESMYGEEGYFYDVFTLSVDIDSDCVAFRWSATTDTAPADFIYEFVPPYYNAAVQFVHLPQAGLDSFCAASPAYTLQYQEVGGSTWINVPASMTSRAGNLVGHSIG